MAIHIHKHKSIRDLIIMDLSMDLTTIDHRDFKELFLSEKKKDRESERD